jgi:hypothetical protein
MYSDSKEWYLDAYVSPSTRENEGFQWRGGSGKQQGIKVSSFRFRVSAKPTRNLELEAL